MVTILSKSYTRMQHEHVCISTWLVCVFGRMRVIGWRIYASRTRRARRMSTVLALIAIGLTSLFFLAVTSMVEAIKSIDLEN